MNALQSQLTGTITSFVASVFHDPIVQTGLRLAGWALVLTWVLSILWVVRDAGARTHNPIAIAAAATSVLLATPAAFLLAIIVWRILRPGETLADTREQRLTIEALRVTTDVHRCGRCAMVVDAGWRRCPRCRNWLLAPCPRCERLVELQSKACPWCALDLAANPLVPMPQSLPEHIGDRVGDQVPAGPLVPAAAAMASAPEAPAPSAAATASAAEPASTVPDQAAASAQPSFGPGVPIMAPSPGVPVMAVSADSSSGVPVMEPVMEPVQEALVGPAASPDGPALPAAAAVPFLEPSPGFLMVQTGWMGAPAMVTVTAGSGAAERARGAAAFRAAEPEKKASTGPSIPTPAPSRRKTDQGPEAGGSSDAPVPWPPAPPPDSWPSLGDLWAAVVNRSTSGDDGQDGDHAGKSGDGSTALW